MTRSWVAVAIATLSIFPFSALAYSDTTTHPALTDEVVDFYNATIGSPQLSAQEKEWIVEGSILEDTPPRWINHFYDPVHKAGWTGEKTGALDPETVRRLSSIFLSPEGALSAVEWSQNYLVQEQYSRYGGNRTWKKALEYYAEGNKEEAYRTLGFILHLLEDMGVPDHARNDTHAHVLEGATGDPGSPLEEWARKWNRENLLIADKLRSVGLAPVSKSSISNYLETLATYSNRYFFSRDTINDQKYPLPRTDGLREDAVFVYGKDEKGKEFPLARIVKNKEKNETKEAYVIDISDEDILDSYFSRLSLQIVLHGAGVIELFHKEAADAVVNKDYPVHLVKYNLSWLRIPTISIVGEFSRLSRATQSFIGQVSSTISNTFNKVAVLAGNVWDSANGNPAGQEVIEVPLDPANSVAPAQTNNIAPVEQTAKETKPLEPAPPPRIVVEEDEDAKELAARLNAQESVTTSTSEVPKAVPMPETAQAPASKQCSFAQGSSPSHQGVILNEVAWMGTAVSANDEWIELKNISGAVFDIADWQLLDQGEQIKITFPAGSKIPAGGYMLLERTDDSSVPNATADLIYSGALSNTNDGLRLFNAQCSLVDEVLANPDWSAGNATDRLTMERDASGFGWHTTTQYGGTPRRENSASAPAQPVSSGGGGGSPTAPAATAPTNETASTSTPPTSSAASATTHVVISEIQAGIAGDAAAEFIELYNPTEQPVNLSGWELRKRTSAGTESNLIDDSAFTGTIPAKGYFLIASPSYAGSVAPDLVYSATSATIAYTNNTIVLYDGDHASAAIVDEVAYTGISAGESIERKAYSSGTCVSAQGSGEYLGNGCDTDAAADFEARIVPKPQNSQNLPESRTAAAVQNPSVSYSSSTMELVFSWDSSADAAGATSTVAYEIQEYNSPGVVILNATSTQEFRKRIDEIGRDYHFSLQAFDAEGLGSATSTLDITVPPFFSSVAWYEDPVATSTYRLETWYGSYPFVPDVNNQSNAWKVVVAYLNEDASKEPAALMSSSGLTLSASSTPLSLLYPACAGGSGDNKLILPDDASRCGTGGGLMNSAFSSSQLEDLHLSIGVALATSSYTTADFVTFAFYSFSGGGGGSQNFSLAAVDKTKYHFRAEPPAHEPPAAPADLQIAATHDESAAVSNLTLSWIPSLDPDSIDSLLTYEWSEESASSTWQTLTLTSGPDSGKKYGALTFPMGETHTVVLRSTDETGLSSATTSQTISLPPSPTCPETSGNTYYAIDCIRLQDGLVKVRWRLLSNPISGAVFGISPYLATSTPAVNDALHKDINGNGSYPTTTASDGNCNPNITPIAHYELGRQYQRNFSSISGVAASDLTATSTVKFAVFQGTPCAIGTLFFDDPVEYAVSIP